jgi:hypothetical protein
MRHAITIGKRIKKTMKDPNTNTYEIRTHMSIIKQHFRRTTNNVVAYIPVPDTQLSATRPL